MGTPEVFGPSPEIGAREKIKVRTKIRSLIGIPWGQEVGQVWEARYVRGRRDVFLQWSWDYFGSDNDQKIHVVTREPFFRNKQGHFFDKSKTYDIPLGERTPRYKEEILEYDPFGKLIPGPRITRLDGRSDQELVEEMMTTLALNRAVGNNKFTVERFDNLMTFLNMFTPLDRTS